MKRDFRLFEGVEKYLIVIEIAGRILKRISRLVNSQQLVSNCLISPLSFSSSTLRVWVVEGIISQIVRKTSGRGEMWVGGKWNCVGLQIYVETWDGCGGEEMCLNLRGVASGVSQKGRECFEFSKSNGAKRSKKRETNLHKDFDLSLKVYRSDFHWNVKRLRFRDK